MMRHRICNTVLQLCLNVLYSPQGLHSRGGSFDQDASSPSAAGSSEPPLVRTLPRIQSAPSFQIHKPQKCVQLTNRPVVEPPSGRGGGNNSVPSSRHHSSSNLPLTLLCVSRLRLLVPSISLAFLHSFLQTEKILHLLGVKVGQLCAQCHVCLPVCCCCTVVAFSGLKILPNFTLSFAQCVR